jgi:hypothetical protein
LLRWTEIERHAARLRGQDEQLSSLDF